MEQERLRNLYNSFLESGDLETFLPRAKGNWEEDKIKFIKIQEDIEEIGNNINVEF